VGVNDGRAWTTNPCLAYEYSWATGRSSPPAFYINTGNPGTLSTHWATLQAPKACADPTSTASVNDTGCAYDYGWNAAQDAFSQASQQTSPSAAAAAAWWLDVETANSWDGTPAANYSDIQGAIEYLQGQHVQVGVYSTRYQWGQITGGAAVAVPNWVAGASSLKQAGAFCSPSYSFTGGPVSLVQYPSSTFDGDYRCP
jgi:hypothetical protein